MDNPELLRTLREELLLRGLPLDYVERVIAEFADHADDLAEEAAATGPAAPSATVLPSSAARLGDPRRLADQITRQFQRRTFLGRHPWWTFLVLPTGALVASWIITLVCIVGLAELSDSWVDGVEVTRLAASGIIHGMTCAAPLLICAWAVRKARQTGRLGPWPWLATLIVIGMGVVFGVDTFRTNDGKLAVVFGFFEVALRHLLYGLYAGFPAGWITWRQLAILFSLWRLAQIALPLGLVIYCLRRWERTRAALALAAHTGKTYGSETDIE
jgi:hypothetical protein